MMDNNLNPIMDAIRFLANNPRPTSGNERYNTEHLYQLIRALELHQQGTAALIAENAVLKQAVGDQMLTPENMLAMANIVAAECVSATIAKIDSHNKLAEDVQSVVGLLESNEWAEHCTKTDLGQRLEWAITEIFNTHSEAVEKYKAVIEPAQEVARQLIVSEEERCRIYPETFTDPGTGKQSDNQIMIKIATLNSLARALGIKK